MKNISSKKTKSDIDDELKFESELINLLFEKGWEREVLKYPTEDDLIQNWADILFITPASTS